MKKNVPNFKDSFDINNLGDRYELRFEYDRKGNLTRVWRQEKTKQPRLHAIVGGLLLAGLLFLIRFLLLAN